MSNIFFRFFKSPSAPFVLQTALVMAPELTATHDQVIRDYIVTSVTLPLWI